MSVLIKIVQFISANYEPILHAVEDILTGALAIVKLIPGSQPDEAIQGIINFLNKFVKPQAAQLA